MRNFSTIVLLCVLLTSCASGPRTEPKFFVLDPGTPPSMQAMSSAASVSVSFVDVGSPYASDGFVYRVSADRWEVDPYNQFLVPPAEMTTAILRNWVRESRLYRDVTLPEDGGGAVFVIDCDITELYGDFRNPTAPLAVMVLDVQVFRKTPKGLELVRRRTFEQSIPVAERQPAALVDAWNEALRLNLSALLGTLAEKAR